MQLALRTATLVSLSLCQREHEDSYCKKHETCWNSFVAPDMTVNRRSSESGSRKAIDLSALAYTLQVGREAMEERLGFVVKSVDELLERLSAYVDGGNDMQGVYQGRVESDAGGMAIIGLDSEMREAVDRWIASRKFSRLLELWVRGLNFDWNKLYDSVKLRRISLPTYPFAKERYWIDEVGDGRSLDMQCEPDGKMKSIENVMNEIGDGTVETDYAVRVLKMLVSGNGNGAKLAYRK